MLFCTDNQRVEAIGIFIMMKIAFIDLEIDGKGRILDIGGVKAGQGFHSARIPEFADFVSDCDCLCGHNIIEHDIKYLKPFLRKEYILIDTLYLSPLLFPQKPYHKLLKDDKILTEELNNPLNDSLKAQSLYDDEAMAFKALDKDFQQLYYDLLNEDIHFSGFFKSIEYVPSRKPFFSGNPLRTSSESYLKARFASIQMSSLLLGITRWNAPMRLP